MNPTVRGHFPLLERRLDGQPIVYLDSAATALKPLAVLDAERAYSTAFTANIHRGKHALSEEASTAYENARRTVARFLGTSPRNVVFTRNTTESLNLVAAGLRLAPDDTVLAPVTEHHSNLAPWMSTRRTVLLDLDVRTPLTPAKLDEALSTHRPRVLAIAMMSNVTGVLQPIEALCRVAKSHGVLTVVDAAQAAAHFPLSLEGLGCDFLAFSGHKVMGPTGIGVLAGTEEALERLRPLMVGGGSIARLSRAGVTLKEVPERFEAGTPNVSGALGLAAALEYLEGIGFDCLAAHDRQLAEVLRRELMDVPGIEVVTADGPPAVPLASIVLRRETLSPDQVALVLSDSYQVMVRSGFHCARPLFESLGCAQGALRASAYLYNTPEELRHFGGALRSVLTRLGERG